MSVKVLFKNNYSKNVKLLVVLLDNSLKLYGDILAIDKKNKGLVSRIIKNKSFSAKNKEKLSLIGLNIANIEEVILYGIGSPSRIKDDGIERIGGNIYSIIPPKVKNIAISIKSYKSLNVSSDDAAVQLAQGFSLRSYNFNKYRSKSKPKIVSDVKVLEVLVDDLKAVKNKNIFSNALKEGVFLTRDLVSEPPNVLNPITLSKEIVKLEKEGI